MKTSPLVQALLFQIGALSLPAPELEYRFHPERKWRFDLAFVPQRIAVEVDGGSWVGGRHVSGTGFEADCEKLNEAALAGWRILRFTGRQIHDGRAVRVIERALGGES